MDKVFSRQALYDLVWSEPVKTIAQRFGMSDVAFKKYCVRAGVPVPERGYWAKLAAGKPVTRFPLPTRDPGANDDVRIGPIEYGKFDAEAELAKPPPEPPVFAEHLDAVRSRVERRLGKVKAVRDLTSPCAGLRRLLQDDAKRAARQQASAYSFSWDSPQFDSGFEKRRLRVLNSLGLGLAKVQVRLDARGRTGRDVIAAVGDTTIKLQLDHPSAKANQHGEWKVREGPAADLRLLVGPVRERAEGYRAVWEDDADGKLEDKITSIALEIVVAGEAEYRAGLLRGHVWAIERRTELAREVEKHRIEAERQARERRAAAIKARREHLFGQAKDWRTAQDIRGFVAAVLAQSAKTPDELAAWADWALLEADALDPVTAGNLSLPDLSDM
ncbi:hypothetical protein [Caulobacter sp. X]|uniref:hypothetical protein n=1 Tax=Caulobacter sp. X TaxID=2048901 RepID=UPI000C144C7D|nr:hypothetical protein [Caulobacter sp. X]PIC01026.1 hypothetical protein CSW60_05650 [Caulobacter sp. X]